MFRKHLAIALLAAAAAAACSDTPTGPGATLTPRPEPPVLMSVRGTLIAGSLLRDTDGRLVSLTGWQTRIFGDLLGAEILVEGIRESDPEEAVGIQDFILLTVDGHPVMDGRLEAREEGYFIRAREGVSRPVYEVPEALAQFVGRRVFVAHEAGFALRFGLLELEE